MWKINSVDAFADRERWNSVADQWLVISGLRCHAAGINHYSLSFT